MDNYVLNGINDVEPIIDRLGEAAYAKAWEHHYHFGKCRICPACGNRALVTATIADDKHDEVYEVGEGCDYCGYSNQYEGVMV